MPRVPVRVVVANHTHAGRRCAPGDVIYLRPSQVRWMGTRVQRVDRPPQKVRAPASVDLPASPERGGDDSGDGGDGPPDDPDPEPEPLRPAGGAAKHRQQGALNAQESPTALTLHLFSGGVP